MIGEGPAARTRRESPLPLDRDDAANDAINGGNERVINQLDAEIERNRSPLNTPHVVTVGAPLLRPGLTISATCSEKYVVTVAQRLMQLARDLNAAQA